MNTAHPPTPPYSQHTRRASPARHHPQDDHREVSDENEVGEQGAEAAREVHRLEAVQRPAAQHTPDAHVVAQRLLRLRHSRLRQRQRPRPSINLE